MSKLPANLEVLSTRAGFNTAVRQIKKTIGIIETVGAKKNLGDLLFETADSELSGEKVALILRILLVDKLGYKTVSVNLPSVVEDVSSLAEEFAKWKAVDLVVSYYHPDIGLIAANPKNAEELAQLGALRKRELLVVYAGKAEKPADAICDKAVQVASQLFSGVKVKIPEDLYKGEFVVQKLKMAESPKAVAAKKAPAKKAAKGSSAKTAAKAKTSGKGSPASAALVKAEAPTRETSQTSAAAAPAPAAAPGGKVRMTPMYSVVVQNELFHNGNVEAWKKIIASYKAKYPGLEVYIYYDGERIMDINSLFKWGKVKHGSAINFAV
ncbi:MAG: hypothetical protein LBV20_01705, partial [Treponema sp.]|nr:hypothetical protein [Treponema sp.]